MNLPSDHALVLAAAATYAPSNAPFYQSFNGAVRVFKSVVGDIPNIAIEGTHDPLGWLLDFLAVRADDNEGVNHPTLGWVHAGFLASAASIIDPIESTIGNQPYTICGHSLGGALALLLAAMLIDRGVAPVKVAAFAPPRVGAAQFVQIVRMVPCNGYLFGNDLVPDIPFTIMPAFPYEQIPLIMIGKPMADRFACHSIANYVAAVPQEPSS